MFKTGKIGVWEPRKGLMPCGFHRMASKPVCSLAIAHRFCCLHSRTSQGRGSVRGEPLTGSPTRVQSPARRRPLLRSKSAAPKRKHHPDGWCFLFGASSGIRTPDTLLKRQVLCRLSYWVMKSIKRKTGLPPQLPDQKTQKKVAGMAGLEPANEGVKVPCLTTWRHPCVERDEGPGHSRSLISFCGVGKGTRTLDTRNHNPVL